jgi:ADP-heptose:LPS heptosyltransferase
MQPLSLQLRVLLLWERWTGYAWYGLSALATALHHPRWRPGELRRILAVKTDHIGDFLLCLPAVRAFAASEPKAEIGFVVGSHCRDLAERLPWVREVHVHDSHRYVRRGTPSPEDNLDKIFACDWDLILDLTNDSTTTLAAFKRPSRYRRDVGTLRLREKLRALTGRGPGLRSEHVSRVFFRALGLAVPAAIQPEGIEPRPDEAKRAADEIAKGWPGERPLAVLHGGALWKFRRWPAVRFAEVALRLEEEGYAVFLVGGPNDCETSAVIAEKAGLAAERDLTGKLDLSTTAAVLGRAAVVVANDGGVMHLAAAQGAPVVGIFGPTSPHLFGPLGERSTFLYHGLDCSPCEQRHCIWNRARCLEPIETEAVVAAALRVAAEASSPAPSAVPDGAPNP